MNRKELKITENNKKYFKRTAAAVLSGVLLLGTVAQTVGAADVVDGVVATPYVSLGADLAPDQRAVVLSFLGLTEEELAGYKVMEITNQQEHEYLDAYLTPEIIGDQAWSSAKILACEKGHGITVDTQNINYCTARMYENALATAGVKNAEIVVAGPVPISGTAALIGIMNAYADMNQVTLDEESVDAATNELVTTSELGEAIGDQEKASELIAVIKQEIAESGIDDPDEASRLVDEAADELGITLDQNEKDQILSLMDKVAKLDLNVETLKEQAKSIYDKLDSMDIHLNKEEVKGFLGKIGGWFSSVWEKLLDLFNSFA